MTLWAYIDERDGRLMEAGLERTIISSPRSMPFTDATALLDGAASSGSMANAKAILSVVDRNLFLNGPQVSLTLSIVNISSIVVQAVRQAAASDWLTSLLFDQAHTMYTCKRRLFI